MFALIHEHPYNESLLIGIFSSNERVQDVMSLYTEAYSDDSIDLHIVEIDSDTDLSIYGYCVFSHIERFGQVAHNIRYVARDPISAVQHAIRLHADEKGMESEWLYERVVIDKFRFNNGQCVYIDEIKYSWLNQ